jgi:hypothetical protein
MTTEDKTRRFYRIMSIFGALTGTIALFKIFELDRDLDDFAADLEDARNVLRSGIMNKIQVEVTPEGFETIAGPPEGDA